MAKLAFGSELRDALLKGVQDTAGVIIPNYGPSGRNTFVEPKYDIPMAMRSGGQILSDFSLEGPLPQLGSAILCQGAKTMAQYTGDGISSTVMLCEEILSQGQKMLAAGADPIQLRKGIQTASEAACKAIWNAALTATEADLIQIARNSVQDEAAGNLLAQALQQAGADGIVSVEDSQQRETTLHWGGIQYDYGWMAPEFANDSTGRLAVLQNPYVLLVDKKIESIYELQTVLEAISRQKRPLLIITADMKPEVLRIILMNVKRKTANIVVATAPGHGDSRRRHMEALALRLGAVRIDEYNLPELTHGGLDLCGQIALAQIGKAHTHLSGFSQSNPERISAFTRHIKDVLSQETDSYQRESLQLTLAILSGQAVTIRAGGVNEIAMFEQKRLLEQGLAAVGCARETGILPGGGKGFLLGVSAARNCMKALTGDEERGALCVVQALRRPVITIAENTGFSGALIAERLLDSDSVWFGYDAVKNEYCDLKQQGILDPAGAVVGAVQIAAETAATILTVEAAVYE